MRNTAVLNRMTTVMRRRTVALALAMLLLLNVLAAALPIGGFRNASADTSSRPCAISIDVEAGSTAYILFALSKEPVLEGGEAPSDYTFWTAIDNERCALENDPRISAQYSEGLLRYQVYCENRSTVKIHPKSDASITAIKLVSGVTDTPNDITALTLSGLSTLKTVDVSNVAALEELNLNTLPALTNVNAAYCSIENIYINEAPNILTLDCAVNNLAYGKLAELSEAADNFIYVSQSDVEIPLYVNAGDTIDVSSCYASVKSGSDISVTSYKWYLSDDTEITSGITGTGTLGVFSVDETLVGKTVYGVAENAAFTEMPQLRTNDIKVVSSMQLYYGPVRSSFIAVHVSGTDASFFSGSADISDNFSAVSDSDGETIYYAEFDENCGFSSVSVVSASPITSVEISSSDIEEINVENCSSLETLSIDGDINGLSIDTINLSNNTVLETVIINDVSLKSLDLSKNTSLVRAILDGNRLTPSSLSLPAGLSSLDINDNVNIDSLSFLAPCSSTLETLSACACSIDAADLSSFGKLTSLNLAYNSIEEITLPENNYKYIDISGNKLSFEALPAYPLTITASDFEYIYSPQDYEYPIDSAYNSGDTVDVSDYLKSSVSGDTVTAVLTNGTDLTVSDMDGNGIFEIPEAAEGDTVYFTFTSEAFPSLVLESTPAEVLETVTYTNAVIGIEEGSGPFSFSIISTAPVLVYWGNGTDVEYTPENGDYSQPISISGTPIPDEDGKSYVSITTAGDVTALDLSRSSDSTDRRAATLDVEPWTELRELDVSGNCLKELDLTANTKLETLDCSDNYLTFATLPDIDGEGYIYSPQKSISITATVKPDTKIDLSAVSATDYTWYNATNDTEITPKTSSNGVFTFGSEHAGITAYCVMTNTNLYPGLEICTTETVIASENANFEAPVAVLYTTLTAGEKISLTLSCDDTVYIDWGNGSLKSDVTGVTTLYTSETDLKGAAIKLYTNGKLTLLSATDLQLTGVELASATDLEVLDLSGNELESIDLSQNTKLKELDLSDNRFIYSTLPSTSAVADYSYSPQALFEIPTVKATDVEMDALKALVTPSATMSYTWYSKTSEGSDPLTLTSDYISNGGGSFTFNDSMADKTVYCVVTNSMFPELSIQTTEMKLLSGGELTMVDSTKLVYDINVSTGSTFIDSDGNTVPAGDLVKMPSASNNTKLTFNSKKFTDTSYITVSALLAKVESKLPSFDASDNYYYIYDFSLLDSEQNEITNFNGSISVTLRYPNTTLSSNYEDYTFYMFHYNISGAKAGSLEEIAVVADQNGLTFTSSSFSPYILVYRSTDDTDEDNSGSGNTAPETEDSDSEDDGKGESPETGDDSESKAAAARIVLWVSIAVMVLLASAAFILKAKRILK